MNTKPEKYILVAEDDETDVLLLQRAFRNAGLEHTVRFVFDGEEVVHRLEQALADPSERLPALVLLDLKMPRMDGLEVLAWMRAHPVLRKLPAILFSSSAHAAEVDRAYELGVNAYLVKPPSIAERAQVARFIKDWVNLAQLPSPALEGAIGVPHD